MKHSFEIEIAKIYGVEEAIIIDNIFFWILKNKANNKHFYDGKYWTYNSVNAFSELFKYWTNRQIERIIKNAVDKGALLKANYNKKGYDRTLWYSVSDEVICIYTASELISPNSGMDFTKRGNGFHQTVEPIPYNKPDSKTYKDIVEYLNNKCKTNYKHTTSKTKSIIDARLKEGFTVNDFKHVIDTKSAQWLGDENMGKYLRPETLFSNKFEGYLNEKPKAKDKSVKPTGKIRDYNEVMAELEEGKR